MGRLQTLRLEDKEHGIWIYSHHHHDKLFDGMDSSNDLEVRRERLTAHVLAERCYQFIQ